MMGSTILAVGAAELNDRAMVDTLLPFSYRKHVKGPFLMLSETPTNDAVNFVTGAGGFLQQVIYGWTGYRLGDSGLEPAFRAGAALYRQAAGASQHQRPRQALRHHRGSIRPAHDTHRLPDQPDDRRPGSP